MGKNVEKAINNFVGDTTNVEEINNAKAKEVVLNERCGLIERVDKILVTKEGKQLLREQY